ncbi:MAG: phasin family protein [Acidobacteriota bacterium]
MPALMKSETSKSRFPLPGNVTGKLKKVALAGVGAVAVAGDEMKGLLGKVDKLAERGQSAQQNGRKVMRQFLSSRGQDVKKGATVLTEKVETRVSSVLGKLNVPTKSDIQDLTRRIDSLARKIDKL